MVRRGARADHACRDPKDVAASFEDAAWAYAQMLPAFVKLVMSLTEGTIAASTAGDDGEEVPVLRYDSDDDAPF